MRSSTKGALIGVGAGAAVALAVRARAKRRAPERVPDERLREALPPRNPRALAYTRMRYVTHLAGEAHTFALLVAATRRDRPVRLRKAMERITKRPFLRDALFGGALVAGYTAATLPYSYLAGYRVERAFGLSRQSSASWAADAAKGLGVSLVLSAPATAGLYALIRRQPDTWYVWAGGLWALVAVVLTNLSPVLIDPLFHRYTPLADEKLRARLLELARRAGVPAMGVFEADWSTKTRKANAYLTGVANTRRIVLTDTLLQGYTPDEIASVLAHELGHHHFGHIAKGILLGMGATLAGFALADHRLERTGAQPGYEGKGDVATLPSLALFLNLVGLLAMPAGSALSRAWERDCDRFALEMTRDTQAFIGVMRKLAEQNLADPCPPAVVEALVYDHPSIGERIRMGLEWEG